MISNFICHVRGFHPTSICTGWSVWYINETQQWWRKIHDLCQDDLSTSVRKIGNHLSVTSDTIHYIKRSRKQYKKIFVCMSKRTHRTLDKSPGYLKVPLPSASLIRLIILPVAVFVSPITFEILDHVGAPSLPFYIISSLPGALPLMQRSRGNEGEEDRKRRLLPARRWGKRRRWRRWRPNLWLWLSSHYNQTGATRRRGECVITLKSPMTKTEDNKQG